jgi:hypothetical protein
MVTSAIFGDELRITRKRSIHVTVEERITNYLFTHKSTVELSSVDQVVNDVRVKLFYGMSPLADDEVRKIVVRWARIHAIGLISNQLDSDAEPGDPSPGPRTNSDSEFIDAVKKAITAVNNGVTIGKAGANVNLGVTGATGKLKKGRNSASLNISWTGTLKLNAASGPFHLTGTLSKDTWEIVLSFPQDTYIPNVATLGKVFSEGERALEKMVEATGNLHSISDVGKVGALMKPHTGAVQTAVEKINDVRKASKKGGTSFGFRVGSPDPGPGDQGMRGGVQGTIVFTYVF